MLKKEKNNYVCMDWCGNEAGFTIISQMHRLLIIIVSLPIILFSMKNIQVMPTSESISIHQFFFILQLETYTAKYVSSANNRLHLTLQTGEVAEIQHYQNVVRRQVEGRGHEVYLQQVQSFQVEPISYGAKVKLTTIKGNSYERTIVYE